MKRVGVLLWCLLLGAALVSCGPSQAERALIATQVAAEIYATQTAVAPTAEPSSTVTPRPTPTPTDTPAPTLTPAAAFERTPAEVVEVVDGAKKM